MFTINEPILEKREKEDSSYTLVYGVLCSLTIILAIVFWSLIHSFYDEWIDHQEQKQQKQIDHSISYQASGVIQQMLVDSAPSSLSEVRNIYTIIINQKEYQVSREGYKQLQIGDWIDIQYDQGILKHLKVQKP